MNTPETAPEGAEGQKGQEEKRHLLTDEAFALRNKLIGEAKAKSRKEYSREMSFSAWGELHQRYDGQEEAVSAEQYQRDHDEFVASLPSEAGDPLFSKEAYRLVKRFGYRMQEEIRSAFRGKSNVALLDVELKLVEMEQADAHGRVGLEADCDSMETCDLVLSDNCSGELLPRKWEEGERVRGNYTPDRSDDGLCVACVPCQARVEDMVRTHNRKVVEGCARCQEMKAKNEKGRHNDHAGKGAVTYLYPRFLPSEEALAALDRKKKAIKGQRDRDARTSDFMVSLGERSEVLRSTTSTRRRDSR